MAIVLFKKGTGQPVKVSEYGFEHSVESGNYFLTKDAAVNYGKPPEVEVEVSSDEPPEVEAHHATFGHQTSNFPRPGRPRKDHSK